MRGNIGAWPRVSWCLTFMTKALLYLVRLFLVLASLFWGMLLLVLVAPFLSYGLVVQGKLAHIWLMGAPFNLTCDETVNTIHQGYSTLVLLLLATLAAVEVQRALARLVSKRPFNISSFGRAK